MASLPESSPAPERVIIKRYANRKLYDTRASRYVTLQQIAEYVKAGDDVQIIDNTSKEDLTSVTLAQILYESERQREPGDRRARSLRDLLREGRERLLESLKESPVGKLVQRVEDGEPGADGAEAVDSVDGSETPRESHPRLPITSPREALDELKHIADEQWRGLLEAALSTVHQLQSEVQRLHSRIEDLEGRLGAKLGKRDDDPPPEDRPKRDGE